MSEVVTTNAVPNPGSNEAIAKGCTCPVIDNGHGRGYYGQPGVYVYTVGCPVHAPTTGMGTINTAARSIEGGERG